MDYSIAEDFVLPSKGKLYSKDINPNIKLRSMTTLEEKKRLSHSDSGYKILSEIIDDCTVDNKPEISSYDMILGDYQYLLYKLRTVTYGPDYKVDIRCPYCGEAHSEVINLDDLEVKEYSEDIDKLLQITLPRSKKLVKLNILTPRMLDKINERAKEIRKKSPDIEGDPKLVLWLEAVINTVDGEVLSPAKLTKFVEQLPMADVNYINKSLDKIKLGIMAEVQTVCPICGNDCIQPLPWSGEFFGPSID